MQKILILLIPIILMGASCGLSPEPGSEGTALVPTPPIESVPKEIDNEAIPEETLAPEIEVGVETGQLAPDFELQTFAGETVRLSDYRGQAVMLDFWASWCPFCRKEFPAIETAYQKYKDQGLVVLGIHRTNTDSVAKGQAFLNELGATFPSVSDPDDEIYRLYNKGLRAMPASIYIDRNGVIQSRVIGPKDINSLDNELEKIL